MLYGMLVVFFSIFMLNRVLSYTPVPRCGRLGQLRPLFNTKGGSGGKNLAGVDLDKLNKDNVDETLWSEFNFGVFNSQTPSSKKQAQIAALVEEISVPADTMDPEWSYLTDDDVNTSVNVLKGYVHDKRIAKMEKILAKRTDNIRMVFENPSNPNNCWAALRTFDTFGCQYVDVITNKESYHNKQRRKSMFEALGAQKWMSLKQHLTTTECLQGLKENGYRIAVTDIHHPSAKPLGDIDWNECKTAIVLGNEKHGITDEAREMADLHFYLPMKGFAESLNVAAFCAVAMAYLEAQGCLVPSLQHEQKQRILLTWLARTAPGSTALMRRAGVDVRTDRLYENIAGFTTKPT